MELEEIFIDRIRPSPNQPRKFVDRSTLKELTESIKNRGLLEEMLVRPKHENFEIVNSVRHYS